MASSRTLPDGTPCWCVDFQGMGHEPRCQTQRAFAGIGGEKPDALDSPAVIAMKRERTLTRQAAFLAAYAETGVIAPAARAADISYSTIGAWEKSDPEFAAKMVVAREMAADTLEQEAIRRARDGTVRPIYQGGALVGEERVYSDTLMTLVLKGARPRKFRENISAELTGAEGGPIHQQVMTDLDDNQRAALRKVLEDAIAAQLKAEEPTEA